MKKQVWALALVGYLPLPTVAAAQATQAEIRQMVGDLNLEGTTVFTANRATYQHTCGAYQFEGLASAVGRLEYGAMTREEQQTFKTYLRAQVSSNTALLGAVANDDARQQWCKATEQYLNRYVDDFMIAHPQLFETKNRAASELVPTGPALGTQDIEVPIAPPKQDRTRGVGG